MAARRGQTLAQMAVSWILSRQIVTSVIIGPRTIEQMVDGLDAMKNEHFSAEELIEIDRILL